MRKYLPTISDLIDRLSIVQLKEVFIPEHKEEYAKETPKNTRNLPSKIQTQCISKFGAV